MFTRATRDRFEIHLPLQRQLVYWTKEEYSVFLFLSFIEMLLMVGFMILMLTKNAIVELSWLLVSAPPRSNCPHLFPDLSCVSVQY